MRSRMQALLVPVLVGVLAPWLVVACGDDANPPPAQSDAAVKLDAAIQLDGGVDAPQQQDATQQQDGTVPPDTAAQQDTAPQQDVGPAPDGGYCATGSTVVISQVYGAGGNSGALFDTDFVELFNRGTTAVDLAGWSLQYASATGPSTPGAGWNKLDLTGTIQPGHYFLIQLSIGNFTGCTDGGAHPCGAALPTPDLPFAPLPDGGIAGIQDGGVPGWLYLSASNGKVALVHGTTALTGTCPAPTAYADLLGYGSANCFEGTATAALSTTTAALRATAGCTDTNVNSADFTKGAPAPRNSATAANTCTGCE